MPQMLLSTSDQSTFSLSRQLCLRLLASWRDRVGDLGSLVLGYFSTECQSREKEVQEEL